MQHASLVAFLSGTLAPNTFMEEIAGEVAEFYADLRETKHGFIAISDGPLFVMTRSAVRRFLTAVRDGQLSFDAAVYVADCIVASDDIEFEDEVTRDAVAFLEDDSSRFIEDRDELWTQEEVSKVLASLD
ncbi:hypothetical protein [Novosphingobium cyanobacteriorum]|uniref:Uncharacterized protein n=1 Tax=Novosphingobium cyanobacteriorum TaxID=3024215 RepID=A0ABT6CKE7_9SPHN|nr:hypothetical protein [Novosphingobium cyanobacteriorum]MDF8334405.1 hypothetical protein [Novosphingobium cyanobacteriorum]